MPHHRAFFGTRLDAEKAAMGAIDRVRASYMAKSYADALVASGTIAPSSAPTSSLECLALDPLPIGALPPGAPDHVRVTWLVTGPDGTQATTTAIMRATGDLIVPGDAPAIGDVEHHCVGDELEWQTRVEPHADGRWSVALFTLPEGT